MDCILDTGSQYSMSDLYKSRLNDIWPYPAIWVATAP